MKKRILPIVLVLVMLLSLLPAQVFAASYTFDPNATIFTQNYTTETPRPNNLGDYFTGPQRRFLQRIRPRHGTPATTEPVWPSSTRTAASCMRTRTRF